MSGLVITMSDKDYFHNGELFLETRGKIDADFVLYTPNLTDGQIKICWKKDIEVKKVDQQIWDIRMQTLKFCFLLEYVNSSIFGKKTKLITFCDFDTFFVNQFEDVIIKKYKKLFENNCNAIPVGTTITEGFPQYNYDRSKVNAGVIFVLPCETSAVFLQFATKCVNYGGMKSLPEYDKIFRTLEQGRSIKKTHTRWNQRWWCDQVFLSAIYLNPNYVTLDLPCQKFNFLDSEPKLKEEEDVYIRHLKSKGRKSLKKGE